MPPATGGVEVGDSDPTGEFYGSPHQAELLAGVATAVTLGHENRIGTELALEPGCDPNGPLIDLGFTPPEPELPPASSDEFVGDEGVG